MIIFISTLILTLIIYAVFRFTPDRFSKGKKAYEIGEYDKALELLKSVKTKDAKLICAEIYKQKDDNKNALDLYIEAYDLGAENIELIVAKLYRTDMQKAFRWYEKAAKLGSVEAMEKLGDIYAEGLGVLQDFFRAHYWYNLASSRQSRSAQNKLKEISNRLSVEQIQKAQEMAKNGVDDGE